MHIASYVRAAAVAFGLAAASAGAAQADAPRVVTASIERILMPIVPDQDVIIGPCPDPAAAFEAGCTWLTPVAPIYLVDPEDRWTLYHELGHRYSAVVLTDRDRSRFAAIMRYAHVGIEDERLADAYATCAFGWLPVQRHVTDPNFPTGAGYSPSRSQQRRVCSSLTAAAG